MVTGINPILQLEGVGQSVWVDYLSRELIQSGALKRLMGEDGVKGVTSNPTIFQKAISGSSLYDGSLRLMIEHGTTDAKQLFLGVEMEDIGSAADLMLDVYRDSGGWDGFVSIEPSPDLAYDAEATMQEVRRLWSALGRRNVFVKVPATEAGPYAIERMVREGININVTLLFSVSRYREVAEAYQRGLEYRVERGLPISGMASVASFFVSRVDTLVDRRLQELIDTMEDSDQKEQARGLVGKAAVANAKLAYQEYKQICASDRFKRLENEGGAKQRLLWASSSTKNPAYSDIKYVEELIAPETINTMTEGTIEAFRDHGEVRISIEDGLEETQALWGRLSALGINPDDVGVQLEEEGVKGFSESYFTLLDEIAARRDLIKKEVA